MPAGSLFAPPSEETFASGEGYEARRLTDQAIEHYRQALAAPPTYAALLVSLRKAYALAADILVAQGDLEGLAQQSFRQGFRDVEKLRSEPDLEPFRRREDFPALMDLAPDGDAAPPPPGETALCSRAGAERESSAAPRGG